MKEEKKIEEAKGGRDLLLERLKKRYPEDNFEDEENFYGRINSDYDENESQLSSYKENEEKLSSLFASDPRSAAFLSEWSKGGDPLTMLVRMMGETTLRDLLDDPDKIEEIASANKEYLDRVANSKLLEKEYEENLNSSLEMIAKLQEEKGYTEEQMDEAVKFLVKIIEDGVKGRFSRESIEMAFKALNHDEDVTAASEEAEVRGRNAKIEARLKKKKGDGTAVLAGSASVKTSEKPMSIFERARGAQ